MITAAKELGSRLSLAGLDASLHVSTEAIEVAVAN
jgi:hypothetical protein